MTFNERRMSLQRQIREIHDSHLSHEEIDEKMLFLDGLMEDLEEEEREEIIIRSGYYMQ